jgi:hypothetical protein
VLKGATNPGAQITLDSNGVRIRSNTAVRVDGGTDGDLRFGTSFRLDSSGNGTVHAGGRLDVLGSFLELNGCGAAAARVGDAVSGGQIISGSPTVCVG